MATAKDARFEHMIKVFQKLDLPSDKAMIAGSGVLYMCGVLNNEHRAMGDVDVVIHGSVWQKLAPLFREIVHFDGNETYPGTMGVCELEGIQFECTLGWPMAGETVAWLFNNSALIDGVRVMSLSDAARAKNNLNRDKDLADLHMIEEHGGTVIHHLQTPAAGTIETDPSVIRRLFREKSGQNPTSRQPNIFQRLLEQANRRYGRHPAHRAPERSAIIPAAYPRFPAQRNAVPTGLQVRL